MAIAWSMVLAVLAMAGAPASDTQGPLVVSTEHANSRSYTVIAFRDPIDVQYTLARPERRTTVYLVVAGTYTSPSGGVDGCSTYYGTVYGAGTCQPWEGIVAFPRGRPFEIRAAVDGWHPTPHELALASREHAAVFQAHLLVWDGEPQHFRPQKSWQRRALVIFDSGRHAVVESRTRIDLTSFAADLAALGVRAAVNLDMGPPGLGWFRDPQSQRIREIGTLDGREVGQSNWITVLFMP